VPIDAKQIRQVLHNLIRNGAAAVGPGGGTVTVRSMVEEGCAVVRISDTGAGAPPEDLDRIFEPFYTTKAAGIGLGLAVTKAIVQDHGGRIEAQSSLGLGLTITVHLPIEVSRPGEAPGG